MRITVYTLYNAQPTEMFYQKILLHNQLCSFKFPIVLCLLILYIVFCCLRCDCLGLAAIKWFLTAFETLNLLTYLLSQSVLAAESSDTRCLFFMTYQNLTGRGT